jgi:hypothetical protein
MMCGFFLYEDYAPASWGNSPGHYFSFTRQLGWVISGGVGALIGFGLYKLVAKIRGKP